MKYKLLLFDADDTLFDFQKAEEQSLELAFDQMGLAFKEAEHLEAYRIVSGQVWEEYGRGMISAEEVRTKRFDLLFQQIKISFDSGQFSQVYLKHLSRKSYLLDGVVELLEYLAPKYTLAIVTNGLAEVQHERFDLSPLPKWFKHLIISEETGSKKPYPDFFEYALRQTGDFSKTETLIVGDSLQSDIVGGMNFGIDTCWFNPKDAVAPEDINPTYVINKLEDLKSIL